jgi:alginate O-acetyltransferase complex protein AlgJ
VNRRVFIFIAAVLSSLLVVPAINVLDAPSRSAIQWKKKSFLYNVDFLSRWTAKLLYPLGISTDPQQVIIGYDDWLFLGEKYSQTLTVDRSPPTEADYAMGQQIGAAAQAWDTYLATKGVKLFRVMVGPNKGTIYSEHLPDWAKTARPNATDALFAGTGTVRYIDLRKPMLAAKAVQTTPLYYKTDTHWNSLGAGIAFSAFAQQTGQSAPELRWPMDATYDLSHILPKGDGDLAKFLHINADIADPEPIIHLSNLSIETTQFDFATKQIMHHGENPRVEAPTKPLLVKSKGALNHTRVLWLRDSFGSALSPLMAATFTDVLQLHWSEGFKSPERFIQLVDEFRPDYVFFTVVERDARARVFSAFPPPIISAKTSDFKPLRSTAPKVTNHLIQGRTAGQYQINGNDPHVDFMLSEAIDSQEARYLNINLTCDDGTVSLPIQLFWLQAGSPSFDEQHSVAFEFKTGQNLIDLRSIPKWIEAGTISRIRLDLDPVNTCVNFKLDNPGLGLIKTTPLSH